MKKISTLLVFLLGATCLVQAQETVLWTGETTPEAITYYDMLGWAKTDAAMAGKYVNFGTAEAIVHTSIVDNIDKAGINKTDKSLIVKSLAGKSWWPDFFIFALGSPISITESNRYLHFFHYRQNLNQGFSVNINKDNPWEDPDKGTKRFDANLSKPGVWEDVVIDLKWFMDNAEPLSQISFLMDRNWGGGAEDPTDYYFDEFILSADPLQRGVTILTGNDLLNGEDQNQIEALVFDTQNAANTYAVIDNPFTTSEVNAGGKVVKFHKDATASWWQGLKVSFPGIHMINYGSKQFLHVMVRTDTLCNIQLHVVDNADGEHTEMFVYPKDEIDGDWFDLVWDLSSYTAIKAMTVRFDVRVDGSGNWINGTPARDFYMDAVVLDGNADQRELISGISTDPIVNQGLKVYTIDNTIYFSLPNTTQANVYDLSGKMVATAKYDGTTDNNTISVPEKGMYILTVGTKKGKVAAKKIFVQ
jgi:hypothetical protein